MRLKVTPKILLNGGRGEGLGKRTVPSLTCNAYITLFLRGGDVKTEEHMTMQKEKFIYFERPHEFK